MGNLAVALVVVVVVLSTSVGRGVLNRMGNRHRALIRTTPIVDEEDIIINKIHMFPPFRRLTSALVAPRTHRTGRSHSEVSILTILRGLVVIFILCMV
jgi:hypothetical protein